MIDYLCKIHVVMQHDDDLDPRRSVAQTVFPMFLLQSHYKSDIQLTMEEQPLVTVSEAFLKGMERKVERLKTLMKMSAILSSTLDPDDLISLAMEKAKSDLDAEACSMLLYNKEMNRLEYKGSICENEKTSELLQKESTFEIVQGIAGAVAETLQPLFLEDVRNDSRFYQEADLKGRDLDDIRPGGLGVHLIKRACEVFEFDENRQQAQACQVSEGENREPP